MYLLHGNCIILTHPVRQANEQIKKYLQNKNHNGMNHLKLDNLPAVYVEL